MAAEQNNNWWMARSKHGRDLIFSSPILMWEAACEYFEHEKNRIDLKRTEIGWNRGNISVEQVVCVVPYTWEGLCLFFGISLSYFRTRKYEILKKAKEGKLDEVDNDFLTVMETIGSVIFKQQIDNANAGTLKESLTAKYLKLDQGSFLASVTNTNGQTNEDGSQTKEFKITLKLD